MHNFLQDRPNTIRFVLPLWHHFRLNAACGGWAHGAGAAGRRGWHPPEGLSHPLLCTCQTTYQEHTLNIVFLLEGEETLRLQLSSCSGCWRGARARTGSSSNQQNFSSLLALRNKQAVEISARRETEVSPFRSSKSRAGCNCKVEGRTVWQGGVFPHALFIAS